MTTTETRTLTVTIDAPFDAVAEDLSEARNHVEWGSEFFDGPARDSDDGTITVNVPMMGGDVRFRVEGDRVRGNFDLYLAPFGAPFGAPLPVRVIPNGDGVDVLSTLARLPGMEANRWEAGLESMERELANLKSRLET